MTIHSLNSTSEAVSAVLPSLDARKPEELLPDSDRVELSEAARSALRQDTIGSAESLPGQGSTTPSDDGESELPQLAFAVSDDEASTGPVDAHDHGAEGLGGAVEGEDEEDASEQEIDPSKKSSNGETLSEEEHAEVENLRERDREVRTHEQAHVAAGGSHVRGGIKYEYQTGPDGRRYAVGGEVSIDTSPVSGDPQKTIQKAQQIRRAALAPAEPSGADRQAAAAAAQMEAEARKELIEERANPADEGSSAESDPVQEGNPTGSGDAPAAPEGVEGGDAATESTRTQAVSTADLQGAAGIETPDTEVGAAAAVPESVGSSEAKSAEPPSLSAVPDDDESELSDLVQSVREGTEEGAIARIATLSYSGGSSQPGGLLDVSS